MMKLFFALVSLNLVSLPLKSQGNICDSPSLQVAKPFVGEWKEYTVTDSSEIYIGRLSTKYVNGGCVLEQSFMASDSTFYYRSSGFVNPDSDILEETLVFSSGSYAKYLWIAEGESLYILRVGGSRKTNFIHRLKYQNISENEYTVIQEESSDGGRSWQIKDTTRIVRIF